MVVFKTILIVCPKDTEALLGLGRCFSTISSLDEAKNCFVQILDDNDNSEAKSELGWVYFLQGHYEESLSIIRSSLIADPSGKNYFRIARVYYAMGKEYVSNKEFAHAHLIKAIKLDPQFSPSFTLLGKYYRDYEKDIVRSIKCYSKAISINPVEADAVSSLSEIWILQGKVADASELLQQYVLLNTRASWAWKQLGILMLDITPAESILCFQACLRLEPNNAKCWTCLGEAYYNEGKYVASIRALDRALVLDNSLIIAMYFRAIVNRRIGNYIDSISDFSKILNDPNQKIAPAFCYGMAETCISYAVELFADGYFGSCLSHLLLAIENCSKVYNLHLLELAGLACLHLLELVPALIDFSCINPALQLFNLLREKKPSDTNASQIFVDCGIFCFQFFLKNVAVISPISASAIYSSMANLHLHSYKLDQNESRMEYAVSSIKSAIKLGSQRWEYWSNYGLLLHRCDKRLSQELFTKAIEFGALQPQPWSNLGFFYLLEGAYELAMQCFEKAQFAVLDYPNSWLGQAILAGLLGNEQSFKFFEHAYDIAKVSNTEILFQYARQCYLFPNHHSSSEVDASFALRKCVELKLADCNMYNLYGLFLERQKKYCAAIDIYYTALSLIHDINQEKAISENLARCLCAKGQFKESVRFFEKALEIGGDAFTLVI